MNDGFGDDRSGAPSLTSALPVRLPVRFSRRCLVQLAWLCNCPDREGCPSGIWFNRAWRRLAERHVHGNVVRDFCRRSSAGFCADGGAETGQDRHPAIQDGESASLFCPVARVGRALLAHESWVPPVLRRDIVERSHRLLVLRRNLLAPKLRDGKSRSSYADRRPARVCWLRAESALFHLFALSIGTAAQICSKRDGVGAGSECWLTSAGA